MKIVLILPAARHIKYQFSSDDAGVRACASERVRSRKRQKRMGEHKMMIK